MGFVGDLHHGLKREQGLKDILEKKYPGSEFHDSPKLKEYDFVHIKPDGDTDVWEVKSDRMAHLTGNIAIEATSRGKESGIRATIADYWCYVISGDYWAIPTDDLIRCIKEDSHKLVYGGDNKSSLLFLLKLDAFKKYATKLN